MKSTKLSDLIMCNVHVSGNIPMRCPPKFR